MDFINSNKEYDLVTMGEVMLRLSPRERIRFLKATRLTKNRAERS